MRRRLTAPQLELLAEASPEECAKLNWGTPICMQACRDLHPDCGKSVSEVEDDSVEEVEVKPEPVSQPDPDETRYYGRLSYTARDDWFNNTSDAKWNPFECCDECWMPDYVRCSDDYCYCHQDFGDDKLYKNFLACEHDRGYFNRNFKCKQCGKYRTAIESIWREERGVGSGRLYSRLWIEVVVNGVRKKIWTGDADYAGDDSFYQLDDLEA